MTLQNLVSRVWTQRKEKAEEIWEKGKASLTSLAKTYISTARKPYEAVYSGAPAQPIQTVKKIATAPFQYTYKGAYQDPRAHPLLKQFGRGVLGSGGITAWIAPETMLPWTPTVSEPKTWQERAARFAGEATTFMAGPGQLYGAIEKPVSKYLASRGTQLPWLGKKLLPAMGAEAVSSAVAAPIRAKLRGEPLPEAYKTELAAGLGGRALFAPLGLAGIMGGLKKVDYAKMPAKELREYAQKGVAQAIDAAKKRRIKWKLPEKYAFNINLNKLKLDANEKKTLTSAIGEIKPLLEKAKGKKLSQQEIVNAAAKSDVYRKITTRAETLETTAAVNKMRQHVVAMDRELTAMIKGGQPVAEVKTTMKDMIDSIRVVSSTASDWGRKLKSLDITVGGKTLRREMIADITKVEKDTDKILKEAIKVDWDNADSVTTFYRRFIKPSLNDVIRDMRYNNMLSNPRTHFRNLFSNVLNTLFTRPATKLLAEGVTPTGKYYSGVLSNLTEAFSAFKGSVSGQTPIKKPDIAYIATGKLPKVWTLPTRLMEAGDVFFTTLIKAGEEAAGKTPKEAAEIAEYSLFRAGLDPTGKHQGIVLSKIDQFTAGVYQLRKVGLDWFIPFIRTPMNFAKQWLEFSPAGLATIPGAAKKKEQLAKFLLGSMVTTIGAKMALEGRTTWKVPTDPEGKKQFYKEGKKPYSVKIGNTYVPMIMFGTFALALAIPAAIQYRREGAAVDLDDDQLDKIGRAVGDMAGFFSQQTWLQGIGNFVRLLEGDLDYNVKSNLAFTASQVVPLSALLRYTATIVDPVFRKGYGFKAGFQKGLPFMTQGLEPYLEPSGEPARRDWTDYLLPYSLGLPPKADTEPFTGEVTEAHEKALIKDLRAAKWITQYQELVREGTPKLDAFKEAKIAKLKAKWTPTRATQELAEAILKKDRENIQYLLAVANAVGVSADALNKELLEQELVIAIHKRDKAKILEIATALKLTAEELDTLILKERR